MKRFESLVLMVMLLTANAVGAQDSEPAKETAEPHEILEQKYPDSWQDLSFSDFLGASESFEMLKPQFEEQLQNYQDLEILKRKFDDLQKLLDDYRVEWRNRIELSNWDLREVTEFKSQIKSLFDFAKGERQGYYRFVKDTDTLTETVEEYKELFKKFYKKARRDPELKSQLDLMKGYVDDVGNMLVDVKKLQVQYAKIYREKSDIFENAENLENLLEQEVEYFQTNRFVKSHVAFYEEDFANHFNPGTWDTLNYSINQLKEFKLQEFKQKRLLFLQAFALILVMGFLLRKIQKPEEGAGRVFKKPFALAATLGLILFRFVAEDITIFWELAFWVLLIASIQWQLSAFVERERDRRGLRWLISVYGILQLVDVIGIPIILFRVLTIGLALLLSLYGYVEIVKLRKGSTSEPQSKIFKALMQALIVLSFGTILAQILGYHLLAVLIFQGTLQSIFLIFLVWQIRFLILKLSYSLASLLARREVPIFKRFRHTLVKKMRFITDVLGVVITIGFMAAIWKIYPNWSQALEGVWGWGIAFEDVTLSLGRVVQAGLILYVTHFVAHIVTQYLEAAVFPARGIPIGSAKAINALITYVTWVLGLFAAFSALGFELQQLSVIAAALSVGIGFGLQNIVNNFVSGLILLFERPVKVGDMLELGTDIGFVEKVGLRSTVVRTTAKTQLIIPNSEFVTQQVTNLTLTDSDFRVAVPVGVAYGSDTELVKQTLIEVAKNNDHIVEKPEPKAMFRGFGDSSLDFELWAWVKDVTHRYDIMSELHYAIDAAFRQKGVTIPFPQRDLHIKSDDTKSPS